MIDLLIRCILGGLAAIGFAILFNVPKRILVQIFMMGAIALLVKTVTLNYLHFNIILASFLSSSSIGIIGLFVSAYKRIPPLILVIPSVIPLIPGIFIYNTLIGLMKMTTETDSSFFDLFIQTSQNGLKATFILMVLAIGISIPNLILRQDSFYEGTKRRKILWKK